MIRLKTLALALALAMALPGVAAGQGIPATDIYLVPLTGSGDTFWLGAPINATARAGYDNQPAFLPDGSGFLYTAIGADGQADIWRYDLATRRATRVTDTPESEYSPTPMGNSGWFSTVRVERDSTQRLWRFPVNGGAAPSLVLERVKPVGYHSWIGDSTLAMFVLGEPATLQVAGLATGSASTYARDIGRGLATVPGHRAVVYVQHAPLGNKLVELSFDEPGSFRTRTLIATHPGQDFFAFTPDGILLSATTDGVLYAWNGECADKAKWLRIGSLGIRNVTRMAVSPDRKWLAVVGDGR